MTKLSGMLVISVGIYLFKVDSIKNRNRYKISKVNKKVNNADIRTKSKTLFWCFRGFSTLSRRKSDQYGGGLLVFVREDIPTKHLSNESTIIKSIYTELNFRKKNWLLCSTYNINRNIITNH